MTRQRTKLAILLVVWAALLTTALWLLLDASAQGMVAQPTSTQRATAPICFGKPATITASGVSVVRGTRGPDVIVVSSGAEVEGLGGDDRICGAARAFGGGGNDRIGYSGAPRVLDLWGGPGHDFIRLRSASFGDLVGGAGRDTILGALGNQSLSGGPGRDAVDGGGGNDQLRGGSGRDVLRGNEGRDRVRGGMGADRIYGGDGPDRLDGGDGTDTARGGPGADVCLRVETAINC